MKYIVVAIKLVLLVALIAVFLICLFFYFSFLVRPRDQKYVDLHGVPERIESVLFFEYKDKKAYILNWYVPIYCDGFSPINPWGFDGKTHENNDNYSIQYDENNQLGVFILLDDDWKYAIVSYTKQGDHMLIATLDINKMQSLGAKGSKQLQTQSRNIDIAALDLPY